MLRGNHSYYGTENSSAINIPWIERDLSNNIEYRNDIE